MQECSYWEHSAFVTLTYSSLQVPISGSLSKVELQKFFKRLRRGLDERKIKYFACGEYGDLGGRPHYHAIVFGLDRKEREVVNKAWGLGFIYMGTVTIDSCKYVAGYIQKKLSGTMAVDVYGDRERPFALMSKGLGKKYVEDNKIELIRNIGLTVRGVDYSLPRYYRKLLADEISDEKLDEMRDARKTELKEFCDVRGIKEEDAKQYLKDLREQRKKEIDARLERKDKRKF